MQIQENDPSKSINVNKRKIIWEKEKIASKHIACAAFKVEEKTNNHAKQDILKIDFIFKIISKVEQTC